MLLDVSVTDTLELDADPEAELNNVDDRDKAVPEAVLAQAAWVLFEGLTSLPARSRLSNVPVDHDKLQSIVNLSSAKPDQALISFKAFI